MTLEAYLASKGAVAPPGKVNLGLKAARMLIPKQAHLQGRLLATAAVRPMMVKRIHALTSEGKPIRLHLGAGGRELNGWLNVDLFGSQHKSNLYLDLLKRLPFDDNTVDAIFHEHTMEHFRYVDALKLARESYRVLRPGGALRIGVPDFGAYATSYAGDGAYIQNARGGRPTPMLALAEVVYEHGHSSIWDRATLEYLLREAGFTDFDGATIGTSFDHPGRRAETIYIEATK
ncbi:MAG: methyltransferase domain-containing protein [Dehalococcoidia bacterium]